MTYSEFEALADRIYNAYYETHSKRPEHYLFTAHDAYVSAINRMSADEIVAVLDDVPAYDCDGVDELLDELARRGDHRRADYPPYEDDAALVDEI